MNLYPVWEILHDDEYESLLEALLVTRGLTLEGLAAGFEGLHAPESLTDLALGAERLERAIRQGERIVVFGDYDVDGVTSTVLLMDFLKRAGAVCDYLLPDRHVDGYGLKPQGVQKALAKGAELIVTVDNGISAFEALALARERQIDVVVIDHHRQLESLPPALAIVNPRRVDCQYPFKELAGVGVTFKVVQALSQQFMAAQERRQYLNELLELVALGTVADVMPVLGENRVFIKHGLQAINRTKRPGLLHLKAVAGYADKPVTARALGFHLGPRINVAGRLKTADLALNLLQEDQDSRAALLADELNRLNVTRQDLQHLGLREAEALVTADQLESDRMLVLLGESWHLGIVGLLAGKLAEKYARPAVVCTAARQDGTYTGSARSIPAYDISAGIKACAAHLLLYGGHSGAAGFSLQEQSFEAFRFSLLEHANDCLTSQDLQPRLAIDLMLRPQAIDSQTLQCLDELEPFGAGHEPPLFGLRRCRLNSNRQIGRNSDHLKIELQVGSRRCAAIWWNQGAIAGRLAVGQEVDVAFTLEADAYRGGDAVQMVLKDMRPAQR